jgi:non-homologous end joining protein Ku
MALKAMWSGVLEINTLFTVHVSVCKATEEYRGKDLLRELCACCHKPFKRRSVCEAGKTRLTEEMKKNGETSDTTEMVKGVEGAGDDYVVLDDSKLKAISEAGTSDAMPVAAVIDLADVPRERGSGLYYLRANTKVKKSESTVEVLCAALQRNGKAIITKWAPRGREQLVAIYAKDGALLMQILMYESEVKEPDEKCVIGTDGVSDPEIEIAAQLLDRLPGEFDFATAEDAAVGVRQDAITAARNDEPIPTKEAVTDTGSAPDLMSALLAATEGLPVVKDKRSSAGSVTNNAAPVGASH